MDGATDWDIRPATADDWPRIAEIRSVAFRWPGDPVSLLPGLWVAADRDGPVACARLQVDGQWFAGRPVPTGLLSSVAVAPEARGRGAASALLRTLLHEARERGMAAASLYPSAVRPYRRAGFEFAGTLLTNRLELADIPRSSPIDSIVRMRDPDLPELMAHYGRLASTSTGAIARTESWWRTRVLSSEPPTPHDGQDVHAYLVRGATGVVGHIVFTQRPTGHDAYDGEIVCRSIGWEEADAGRAVLGLLASGRPLTSRVSWPGSLVDPVVDLVDVAPTSVASWPWMTRLLDPAAAIDGRTCHPAIRTAFSIQVRDGFAPSWSVSLRITLEHGHVRVDREDADGSPIDVGILAAILAGAVHPHDAVRAGRLGAVRELVDGLAALAPSGRHWIGDAF